MSIVFVTGATGFLGSRLVRHLIERGWTVRALHRSQSDAARMRAIGAEPVKGDLDDVASLRAGMTGAQAVVHAAALFKMWAPKADFERANLGGTRNVLAAAKAEQIARFIQIGAAGVVMGGRSKMIGVTEDAPLAFPSWAPYLTSKARAEQIVLQSDDPAGGMRTGVILPPMIWGADMPMLHDTIASVKAGRFAWPGGGKALMSTCHVDNVCHAAILALDRAKGGQAYFITDGESRTLREVVGGLLATRGIDAGERTAPLGAAWFMATTLEGLWRTFRLKGEPPLTRQMLRMIGYDFTLDDRRAREDLGYSPIVTWDEGIELMQAKTR